MWCCLISITACDRPKRASAPARSFPQNDSLTEQSIEPPKGIATKDNEDEDPETEEEGEGPKNAPGAEGGGPKNDPVSPVANNPNPPSDPEQPEERRMLVPLDVPLRKPEFVPPPIDPFTGGPIVPPPPAVPPGIIEDDYLPVIPFFVTPICGNGILTAGKQCEDGNIINGDGCSSACKKEYCGNGYVEIGEQCDNGAGRYTVQGPNCDQYCQFIICGDGYVTGDEECDDGNRENCDGCSRDCKVESPCFTCPTDASTAYPVVCPCANSSDS
ncbi:MAG TPA: DUF4215 domain-containing protein [Myxococcota bacterium]|nr:DUF4215 domain-containing protein [Myxococcota bacterium]